ncbi:MAG TPA: hypothetical protein VFD07_11960 [Candidatus Krumholzibacteria bacterium]|nr:hypothetical protein [Candidatus Krumholzibacteria bacterium]
MSAGLSLAAFLYWSLSLPVSACVVGEQSNDPAICITLSPPDCCHAAWGGTIAGTVANVETDDVVVFVYAETDVYYVQPVEDASIAPSCGGVWSTTTHGGARYAAILARRTWRPPPQMTSLPEVGGVILAVARAPESQRRVEFGGETWIVKSSGGVPFGPGSNRWSDGEENVWVDAAGLHLRLVERDGRWTCSEVMSEFYVGHGRYRFTVASALETLDPAVVFAGFLYAEPGLEADIEFGQIGGAFDPVQAQYVVQPDAPYAFGVDFGHGPSTHEIVWQPQRIDFSSCIGGELPVAAWSRSNPATVPQFERMHFNLWLAHGAEPGGPVEIVITRFERDAPTDEAASARFELSLVSWSANPLSYAIEVQQESLVRLQLFDPRGRRIGRLLDERLSPGRHTRVWQPRVDLARGIYFLHLERGSAIRTARVVVLR